MKINFEFDQSDVKVTVGCLVLAVVIFIIDSLIPLGVAGGVPYILVVLISLWSRNKRMPIYMAVVGSVFTIIGFLISPAGGEFWQVITNRLLALFAVWVTAVLGIQRMSIYDEKEAALQEVKQLSGLLPICSQCKKIRDDRGYWNNLEAYIETHSDVFFSHSLCMDCSDELYGNEPWYRKMKEKQKSSE
ncbi:MAG: hypothetical protein MI802_03630 [Desulfobacterales bacterium]|nr:hypothetical protein [Desulfobacterales bacterium]